MVKSAAPPPPPQQNPPTDTQGVVASLMGPEAMAILAEGAKGGDGSGGNPEVIEIDVDQEENVSEREQEEAKQQDESEEKPTDDDNEHEARFDGYGFAAEVHAQKTAPDFALPDLSKVSLPTNLDVQGLLSSISQITTNADTKY